MLQEYRRIRHEARGLLKRISSVCLLAVLILVSNYTLHLWLAEKGLDLRQLQRGRSSGVLMQEMPPGIQLDPVEAQHESQMLPALLRFGRDGFWRELTEVEIDIQLRERRTRR